MATHANDAVCERVHQGAMSAENVRHTMGVEASMWGRSVCSDTIAEDGCAACSLLVYDNLGVSFATDVVGSRASLGPTDAYIYGVVGADANVVDAEGSRKTGCPPVL